MKTNFALLLLCFCGLQLVSCNDDEPAPQNPFGNGNGRHTFWIDSDLGAGIIVVKVEGETIGSITHFHPDSVTCGNGDADITKPAGTYTWSAASATGKAWSGTFTVTDGHCSATKLTLQNSTGNTANLLPPEYSNQGNLTVHSPNIQVCLRDWDQLDGDTITLLINGEVKATRIGLSVDNQCWPFTLPAGNNWVAITCSNPGTTAAASPRFEITYTDSTQGFNILSYPDLPAGFNVKVEL